jgi:hypothetical protein
MRLEDVTARIRPRGSWESADLGFALVRRQFGTLLLAWCLTVGPLWAALLAASHWISMGWIVVIIWWLKPFYGRVPLFILSRSLFGSKPTLRETLRAWPRLLTSRFFGIIFARVPWLIVRPSFAWHRALLLPVLDLEGQRGKGLRQRQAILLQQAGGASGGLTFMCGAYQICLVFAVLALGAFFSWNPAEGGGAIEALQDAMMWDAEVSPALAWTMMGSYLVTLMLVELFYIGAGFGLYLNCRTSLEGWDVELSFRRLAQRVTKIAAVLAAVAFLCSPAEAARPVQNLEKPTATSSAEKDRQLLDEVFHQDAEHEDFKIYTEKHTSYNPKFRGPRGFDLGPWADVLAAIGWVLFYLVITALVALIAWLIWKARKSFGRGLANDPAPQPRTIMGMDISPESLPADILAAARAAWLAGDARGALSLLYRGSLLWLVHTARLPIRESDTEGDCLRHSLVISEPAPREYFGDLTTQWIQAAYATHLPAPADMERLLASWPYQAPGTGRTHG